MARVHYNDELLEGSTNEAFEEALATIEPLPARLVAAETGSVVEGPTRGFLEALRHRGSLGSAALGRRAREEGNRLVKEACGLPKGNRQDMTYHQATLHYLRAGQVSEESVVAACNGAARFLMTKE